MIAYRSSLLTKIIPPNVIYLTLSRYFNDSTTFVIECKSVPELLYDNKLVYFKVKNAEEE